MANLKYLGPANNLTPVTNKELTSLPVQSVTQAQITAAIDQELADKASGSFVNAALDGKLTSVNLPSYGAGYLQRSRIGQSNGPAGLTSGRVPTAHTPAMAGGKPWKFLGSSSSWATGIVSATIDGDAHLLTTWTLPNIGYSYIPIFTGSCQIGDPAGGEVQVRYSGRQGAMFARAVSGNTATYEGCPIVPAGTVTAITSGTFYVVAGKKFAGGANTAIGAQYNLSCFAVPA